LSITNNGSIQKEPYPNDEMEMMIANSISRPTEKLSRRCAQPKTVKMYPISYAQRSAAARVGRLLFADRLI
jgi:hypothetical protein